MADLKFPEGSILSLDQIDPEDRITLADFGGSQDEREGKYQQAISYQNLHKKKLLRNASYDPEDPAGVVTGIPVTSDELKEANIEQGTIPIPVSDDETFVGLHMVIPTVELPLDETNAYYREVIKLARNYVGG